MLLESDLKNYRLFARGKVRDVYEDGNRLLIVATDRISAFDYILPTGIPDKGRVLTQMTLFWLDYLKDVVPNHFLSADTSDLPPEFAGRSMWVKRADMFQVECVARGYLVGSGWKDYQKTGAVCGIGLPAGLRESDALPEPIFTPATKAVSGHDENISFDEMAKIVGAPTAAKLRDLTLGIYKKAADYARTRGIIIADTKFEFGTVGGQIVLADEVLTPDSSRFWPANQYAPGKAQPSYDKQFVRDYLESIQWNKQPPAPALPEEIAAKTSDKYKDAYRELTGRELPIVSLLDIVLIAIVGGSVVFGFLAGFARAGIGFLATVTGILFGFWFYGIPAAWIHKFVSSVAFSNLMGFLVVFFACAIVGGLIGKLLSKLFRWTGLSWLDRLMGGGFGLVRGSLIAVAFVAVLMAFTPRPVPAWITGSFLLPYAIDASNVLTSLAPRALKDPVRESVGEIRQAWDDQVRKSRSREEKREDKQDKRAEPKSAPPKAVNQ